MVFSPKYIFTILYLGTMIYRTRNQVKNSKKRKDPFPAQQISTKKVKISTPKK